MAQSPEGYLWIGTRHGLARFDGVHFKTVPGLEEVSITALCEGHDGTLWIGTGGGGLKCYRNGKVADITASNSADNVVLSIVAGRTGSIWVGTTNGLSAVEEGFLRKHLKYEHQAIRSLAEDGSGRLWAAAGDGSQRFQTSQITNLSTAHVFLGRAVCFADKTNMCVGSSGGLACLSKGEVKSFNKQAGLSGDMVNCLCPDNDGNLWIGTDSGLNCLTRNESILEVQYEGESLDMVYTVYQDREHNIWAGTRDGLYRLNRKVFTTYTTQQGLTHNNVTSVLEGFRGRIWIGTLGGGLDSLKNGVITRFVRTNNAEFRLYFNNQVLGLNYCSPSNALWVGTDFEGGMFHYEQGKFVHYWNGQGQSTLSDPAVRVIFEDWERHRLWVGTRDALNVAYRGHEFRRYTTSEGLAGNTIYVIIKGSAGDIWVGTDGGLSRFHGDKITNFTIKDGLSHNTITALYEDASKALWIGTAGGGLNCFEGGKFRSYTARQGLLSDEIFEIVEDDEDRLWMTCGSGVFWVARKDIVALDDGWLPTIPCVSYGKEDGLGSATCNNVAKPAAYKSHDGRLWFATVRGLSVVDPASIPPVSKRRPPVLIEEVLSDRKSFSPTDSLTLPAGRGDLEFRFTALSFRGAERNRFKYQLQGVDPDWVEAGTLRFARYNNIYPGRYSFRVAACNCDGVWNEIGASLSFVVLPHYWQTSWFKACVICGAALLGIFVYKVGLGRVRAMERMRVRIAADLHDEVSSSLGSISLLSQKIQTENPLTDEQRKDLASIKRISTQSANSIRDIVWFINPEYDTMEDLLLRMKDAAHTMLGGMHLELAGPQDGLRRDLSLDFRQNIFRMFKEILGNVARHSQASAVKISIAEEGDGWHLVVKDNGIGFDAASIRRGNGLANLKRRAEKLHGVLEINSCPGEGTTVSFFVNHL